MRSNLGVLKKNSFKWIERTFRWLNVRFQDFAWEKINSENSFVEKNFNTRLEQHKCQANKKKKWQEQEQPSLSKVPAHFSNYFHNSADHQSTNIFSQQNKYKFHCRPFFANDILAVIRPVHNNFFWEFSKMQGTGNNHVVQFQDRG